MFGAEAVANQADVTGALRQLDKTARLRRDPLSRNGRGVYFYRFRSFAFGDGRRPDEIASFSRGVRLVKQQEVRHQALLDAAVAGVDFLARHQGRSGRLPARYEPWSGKGSREGGSYAAAEAALGLAISDDLINWQLP